jgi:hypothetical protein
MVIPPVRALRAAGYLVLVALTAICVIAWWSELSQLWIDHFHSFLVATVVMAAATVLQARNFLSFIPQSPTIGIASLSRIWALGALANYAGPLQPGIALRVFFLHRVGISPSTSLVATWRQLCMSVWISLLGLSVGLALIDADRYAIAMGLSASVFAALHLLRHSLAVWLGRVRWPEWLVARRDLALTVVRGFSWRGGVGVVLQYVIGTLLVLYVYRQFGARIELGHAIVIASAIYASALIAVMPGNLGVMDGIYLFGGHSVGLTGHESAAIALLIRAAHIASCCLIALLVPSGQPGITGSRA